MFFIPLLLQMPGFFFSDLNWISLPEIIKLGALYWLKNLDKAQTCFSRAIWD